MDKTRTAAVDLHVGHQILRFRRIAGMSQTELAEAAGVKFQQIQKYECAHNRVSASRLLLIAEALGRPVSDFYAGLEGEPVGHGWEAHSGLDYTVVMGPGQNTENASVRIYGARSRELSQLIATLLNGASAVLARRAA